MTNLVLMKQTRELEDFSKSLGFEKTLFLDNLTLIKASSKKDLLKQVKEAKNKKKLSVFKAESEELFRFALEKTTIDIVFGQELINPKDSLHFPRGGLDQIICKIAKEKEKTIAFSFSDILESGNRGRLLGRIRFNFQLCKKYGVKTIFSSFAEKKEELRSAKDLKSFLTVLSTKQ